MASNRRSFLRSAGVATAVASAVPLALSLPGGMPGGPATVSAAEQRTYTGGRFALDLNGSFTGIVTALSGGHPYGVVTEFSDGSGLARKHIGNPKYEEIRFRAHSGLGEPLWAWVSAMVSGEPLFRSGAVHILDSSLTATNMIEFEDALITEITFPALDGASKEIAYLDITITPTITYLKPGKATKPPVEKKQKQWLCSNFRIRVGDLPCNRVSKVDSFTIKQGIAEFDQGDERIRTIEPTKMEYPNIAVTLSEVDGAPWFTYLDSFVVQGKNSPADEVQGAIEFLSPDLKTTMAQVTLDGMGMFRLDHTGASDASAGKGPRTIEAEFYTNSIQFSVPRAG